MLKKVVVTFLIIHTPLHANFLTEAERALLDYLTAVVTSTAVENDTYLDPWVVCKDERNREKSFSSNPFLSSPLLSKSSSDTTQQRVFAWLADLLTYGTKFKVNHGLCRYRFEYFGRCLSQGIFAVSFDGERINFFDIVQGPEACR